MEAMALYVLIAISFVNGGQTITPIYFQDKETCEIAAKYIVENSRHSFGSYVKVPVCLRTKKD